VSREWRAIAIAASGFVTAVVIALPWSPIASFYKLEQSTTDHGTHVRLAEEIVTNGITFPHFLWHVLVVAVHAAGSWSWMDAAKLVVIGSYALQAAVLAWFLVTAVPWMREGRRVPVVVAIALLVVIAGPVTILTWQQPAFYYGYLNMDPYASPTHALLKPLALLAFGLAVRAFAEGGGRRDTIVLMVAVALSALAKPSLSICLVPATVVLAASRWFTGGTLHTRYLLAGVLIPSAAILVWQYLFYFAGGRSAVFFAPFMVMGYYAKLLGPKFVMSILLPLTVLLVYRRQALKEPALQLAWVQFAFAAGYTYLLAETREPLAGNFAWTGQIATYLLFVSSTVVACRNWNGRSSSVICATAFALHAVSGVLFFMFPFDVGRVPPP
jgi:hypothetical protein